MTLKKVHILAILDCYCKIFPLIYIGFDSEGITVQGSCDDRGILATTVIPRDSLEDYEGRKPAVVAMPNCLRRLEGRCVGINVLRVDSWRVRNVFISDNGVSYEVLSHPMYTLTDQPRLYSGISFERYPAAKKCFGGVDTDIEVSVADGIASFRGGHISSFIFGEPGEPYCKIPAERIKY